MGGQNSPFYLVRGIDVALGHYILDVCLQLADQALLAICAWGLGVLCIRGLRWRGFLLLFLDGLADEDFVDLLTFVLHVLLEYPHLFLKDFLFGLELYDLIGVELVSAQDLIV